MSTEPQVPTHTDRPLSVALSDTATETDVSPASNNVDKLDPVEKVDEISIVETLDRKLAKQIKIQRILIFLGLQLALFLAALDGTIVSTALPRIGSDFNQMAIVSWVATAYILTFDAFQPLFSKFSDIFGRKWIMIFGIVVFLIGSVLCGAAQSMIMLIVSRAIAGIGGAGIFSMVFVIITDLVPLEQRGSYQGLINAVFALSSVFGPLIGGSFTDYVTWRWNFYINLPIGALALAVLMYYLKSDIPKGSMSDKLKRIDYVGTVIVLAFATLFLLAMNFGGQTFPWKSAAVIVPLVLTAILVGLLAVVESKFSKEPLMPPRLFKNRTVLSILITNWFFGITFYSMVYYLPIYFQVVRADSAMWSGIRLIPMQMVVCVGATMAGAFISKTNIYKPLIIVGMALLTLSVGLLSLFDENTGFSKIYGFTVIGGGGLGLLFSSTIIGLQASVEARDIAVVTGLGNFSRILGGALGVAISSAVLNSSLTQDLPGKIPQEYVGLIIASSEYVRHGLPAEHLAATLGVYVKALRLIWYVTTPMCGVGFIASNFIRSRKVGETKVFEKTMSQENASAIQEDGIITGASAEDVKTSQDTVMIEVADAAASSAIESTTCRR
ncbi:major facilitator superfamily domain-containing protein [Phycomyces blakesleeanus]|uniref:Major facilitator superfamily (MFS) profile domain-containing protein n=2 Tax=Phycomyces blakesleeanus TaxID=4837 RepID=A0A162X996_PHYB8|nr:hypothetical protein PHYBLDRAFT_133789 [Phycomyces blakesleeanus NRRL 1555(-)]OAD73345.1 hypothetical protein PHYBLDRAFT_133789 [Phycomyces blakesleeanus NRRL 1555(-)]|eukprot:XP_018291385.1 hypothetical protein PHYBLDRAFT_133789 [Phycomyces blakesleeanus NRRL 1555(-)]